MPLDLMQVYRSYQGGRESVRENRLADLDRSMRQQSLDMQTRQFEREEEDARVDRIAAAIHSADTPEKWAQTVSTLKSRGIQFDPGEDLFENRQSLLDQAVGLKEKMAQERDDRSFQFNKDQLTETKRYHDAQIGIERDKMNQGPGPTDDMREYEFYRQQAAAAGQPVQSFNDWMTGMKRASASQVNVGGGSDKQIFDAMNESAVAARSAMTGLNSLREAKQAISSGAITGQFANERLALQKIGAWLGVADPSTIVNTETFRSSIAPQVAALMKATVGTTQISNADREFAEKAAGGSITLDEKSIARLIDIMERAGSAVIEGHTSRLDKVYPQGQNFDRERALFGVDMPAAAPPAQQQDNDPLRIR